MTISGAARARRAVPSAAAEVLEGLKISAPVCLAVVPLGLALGVVVVQAGLAWWWAPVIAALVFAGTMEFLLVGLLAAAAPLAQVAVGALAVNFRHVFYALSFPLHRVPGLGGKAYSTFTLTDEAFALAVTRDEAEWSRARLLATQGSFHLAWVVVVTLGAGIGGLIPAAVVGLDFAVTAIVVVLGIEAYKVQRSIPVAAMAGLSALVGLVISPASMLPIAMGLFVAMLLVQFYFERSRGRI